MIERWPDRSVVFTELSGVLLATGQWEEAASAARRSLTLTEASTAAWNNLGAALGNLGKLTEAREAYSKALLVDPENSGAMVSLADLFMKTGAIKDARVAAELAFFWRPEKISVLRVLGECYLRAREFGKAAEIFRELIARDEKDSVAWFNLSLCHQATGVIHEQIRALLEVLKLRPDDGEAANTLLQAHVDVGENDEAIAVAERMQQMPRWEVVAIAKRAQLYAMRGDAVSGYAILSTALKRHERSAILWFTMVAILRDEPRCGRQAAAAAQNALLCAKEQPGQLTQGNVDLLKRWSEELG